MEYEFIVCAECEQILYQTTKLFNGMLLAVTSQSQYEISWKEGKLWISHLF